MVPKSAFVAIMGIAVFAATACSGDTSAGPTKKKESVAGDELIVAVDLPLQGATKDSSEATIRAINLYLDHVDHKAGKFKVKLKIYDNSTADKGAWDEATCAKNADEHVASAEEVAVMGAYNSGCTKIQAPVLNLARGGPMLMISHASTNPGLTLAWEPGEPEKYFPSGELGFARVITTDNFQGSAAAQFAAIDLKVRRCAVLNDNQTYGQGVAKAFQDEAREVGIKILGNQAWDLKQKNYTELFQELKARNPDCIYLGGTFSSNGGQLVKDKVKVLGDNSKVKLLGPDGFTGYPDLDKLPDSAGMYLTFAGLSNEHLAGRGGSASMLLDAYQKKYGSAPATNYALYGVSAVQVILAAIEASDGTRKGVRDAIFEGSGVSVSAEKSAIGKALKIDPRTGDILVRDISVLLMKDQKESFLKAWPVL